MVELIGVVPGSTALQVACQPMGFEQHLCQQVLWHLQGWGGFLLSLLLLLLQGTVSCGCLLRTVIPGSRYCAVWQQHGLNDGSGGVGWLSAV